MTKKILVFSDSYPYGHHETFLGDELVYLSQHFDEILIQPLVVFPNKRTTPKNVTVLPPLYSKKTYVSILLNGLINLAPLGRIHKIVASNFIQNVGQYLISRKIYSLKYLHDALNDDEITKYFYWGKGAANISVFYSIRGKKIVRLHGYDLYGPEIRKGNIIPLREELIKVTSNFVFISDHGARYFQEKYGVQGKVFKLGIQNHGPCRVKRENHAPFTILSCSSLIALKRVPAIASVISKLKDDIHWIHIGDGPQKEEVFKIISLMPPNIKVTFKGHITHEEVITFYQNNFIDLLISLSESEGLPFSMMEALSFGIPIVATNVGGVKEIVGPDVGELVPYNFSIDHVAEVISRFASLTEAQIDQYRERAIKKYNNEFNAERNYTAFIKYLVLKS